MHTGIIILAAGGSQRLGRPKQLLTYRGKTLIQHSISVAQQSHATHIIVLLGDGFDYISKEIPGDRKLRIVHNKNWTEGVGSSIRVGISTLLKVDHAVDNAILMVCDQPYISASLLNELIERQQQTGKHIVASKYDETLGTPALFEKRYFKDLSTIAGDQGAKKIILGHAEDCASVPFPMGNIDIDTPEDLKRLT